MRHPIIALNNYRATLAAKMMGWRRNEWYFVDRPEFLRGLPHETAVFLASGWGDREDLVEIMKTLEPCRYRFVELREVLL